MISRGHGLALRVIWVIVIMISRDMVYIGLEDKKRGLMVIIEL